MRKLKNWLLSYNEYTQYHEAPDSFHLFTGLAVLSGAVRRQIYFDMGYFKIYPNLYIVLVSPTGKAKKTSAAEIGISLLRQIVGVKISADLTSREALIKDLAESQTAIKTAPGTVMYHCSMLAYSEEFSVFLGKRNYEMINTLTSLFNCLDKWEYRTISRGLEYVSNVWFSLFACTTPTHLYQCIPFDSVGAGFTARIIFVWEAEARHKEYNPKRHFLSGALNSLKKDLIHDLNIISRVSGEIGMTPEADKAMEVWYNTAKPSDEIADDERFSGYFERKQSYAIKLATLLTVAETNELVITKETFEKAVAILDSIEVKLPKVFGSLGRGIMSPDIERVLTQISQYTEIEHSRLLEMNWRHCDRRSFQLVVDTLVDMGVIERLMVNGQLHYKRVFKKRGKDG